MEIIEVLLWIVGILVVLGVIVGILAFLGLRRLWRFVDDAFTRDGRSGPGPAPMSRRRTGYTTTHDVPSPTERTTHR